MSATSRRWKAMLSWMSGDDGISRRTATVRERSEGAIGVEDARFQDHTDHALAQGGTIVGQYGAPSVPILSDPSAILVFTSVEVEPSHVNAPVGWRKA